MLNEIYILMSLTYNQKKFEEIKMRKSEEKKRQ
jgi:hypothetical protein